MRRTEIEEARQLEWSFEQPAAGSAKPVVESGKLEDPFEPLADEETPEPPGYVYSFDFDQGMGPWTTWLAPSVVTEPGGEHESFTRLNAPGLLDPNHLDGIGALRLIAHLSMPAVGSPGALNLTDAEFEITIRATDYQANGGKLVVWLCRYVPEEGIFKNYYVDLVANNWANTGDDLHEQLIEGEWVTITVSLSDDPADWTYAGENHVQQGDWADRYQPYSLTDTLNHTDATLHLVVINDEPDEHPTGFLDIANITVRTHTPATPLTPANDNTNREFFRGLEDQDTTGTLAGDGIVDLNNATFTLVPGSATNGTVEIDPVTGEFVFTPNADYFGPTDFVGPATFLYTVTDGVNTSAVRTAYLYIGGINDAPTATTQVEAMEIAADAPFTYALRVGADVDRDERLTYHLVEGSETNGTVTIDPDNGRYVFTPTAGFSGEATFSYYVSDGQLESTLKTVTLTVLPAGEQPDRLTYEQAVDLLIGGDLQAFIREVILLAESGHDGACTFYGTWLRYGQHVPRDTALAAYYLEQARHIPDAALVLGDMYAVGEGVDRDYAEARELFEAFPTNAEALYRLANLYDHGYGVAVDDAKAVELYLQAAMGGNADAMYTLGRRYLSGEGVAASAADAYFWIGVGSRLNGGPALSAFDGLMLFNMQQAIDLGLSPAEALALDAAILAWSPGQPSPVNDAPDAGAAADPVTGPAGQTLAGTLPSASDADGDELSYELVVGATQNGTVTLDAETGEWVFTPAENYFGPAEFRYVVSDGQTTSEERTVNLTIEPVTLASPDAGTLAETATLTVDADAGLLSNDMTSLTGGSIQIGSVNGEPANVGQAVAGTYGSIVINADGSYSFTADPSTVNLLQGQTATETFTYTIVDAEEVTSTTTLTLTITGAGGAVFAGDGLLVGSAYGDVMIGGAGDNVIKGEDGNDVIDSGEGGANELYGGAGNDIVTVRHATDVLFELAGEGTDTVQTDLQAYVLPEHWENLTYTGALAFSGTGNAANNVLRGGAADDVLIGGLGNDTLIGAGGVDTVNYEAAGGGVTASIAAGSASSDGDGGVDGFSGIENLVGSAFDDTLSGNGGNNRLVGGAGADNLSGLNGVDVLVGGAGVDILNGGGGSDTADYSTAASGVRAQLNTGVSSNDGDGGTDTLIAIEHLIGSDFNDLLVGDGTANVLRGGLGTDTLLGLAGNDTLYGGAGASNQLQGGLGDDRYILEANDTVVEMAGEGTDTVETHIAVYNLGANIERLVFGGTGDFTGTGNSLANIITGGAGNDVLRGRGGADTLNGGLGTDTADYTQATAGVQVSLATNVSVNDGEGGTDILVSIENLTGSQFDDILVGNDDDNLIIGGLGLDVLIGGAGNDVLRGGQHATNQVHGGLGDDWFVLDVADSVIELEGEGVDTVEARISSYTLAAHVENLIYTGPVKFSGWGNTLDNHITGGALDDYLRGMGGNDVIDGGAGMDTVYLRGLKADYTVTAEDGGWRIVDSVADRDGSTFVESIELLRFTNGSTTLSYPSAGPMAAMAAEKGGAMLLPPADDFLLPPGAFDGAPIKGLDDLQILPVADEDVALSAILTEAAPRLGLTMHGEPAGDLFDFSRDDLDPWF